MKKSIIGITLLLFIMMMIFTSCNFTPKAKVTGKTILESAKKSNTNVPILSTDTNGGVAFDVNGRKYTVWGVENDPWQTLDFNIFTLKKYIESSKYVNANCIAIYSPWKIVEAEKGVYDFSNLDYYISECRKNNLKVVLYWTSINNSGGDQVFVPNYIRQDSAKYSRVTLTDYKDIPYDKQAICPADPDTFEREQIAVKKLFEHIKEINTDGIILAVNIGHENDFMHDIPGLSRKNKDIRCVCENCEKLFVTGEGNLKYMTKIFTNYTKKVIDTALSAYQLPIYTPMSSLMYWPGGRFVEQPEYIKQVVNLKNHIVCPSVAPTPNAATFKKEMDQFVKIPGNYAFASGIDTGWSGVPFNNQVHLEIAPWLNIFQYNSLGAIYWDHPEMSITKTKGVREKLRTGWGPLKASEYYISSLKGEKAVTLWWEYDEKTKQGKIGNFDVTMNQDGENNYGYAICLDQKELILSGTTYKNAETNISVKYNGSINKFKFEKGHFDDKGIWAKTGDFKPVIKDKTIDFVIKGDSGDYENCVYRIVG